MSHRDTPLAGELIIPRPLSLTLMRALWHGRHASVLRLIDVSIHRCRSLWPNRSSRSAIVLPQRSHTENLSLPTCLVFPRFSHSVELADCPCGEKKREDNDESDQDGLDEIGAVGVPCFSADELWLWSLPAVVHAVLICVKMHLGGCCVFRVLVLGYSNDWGRPALCGRFEWL